MGRKIVQDQVTSLSENVGKTISTVRTLTENVIGLGQAVSSNTEAITSNKEAITSNKEAITSNKEAITSNTKLLGAVTNLAMNADRRSLENSERITRTEDDISTMKDAIPTLSASKRSHPGPSHFEQLAESIGGQKLFGDSPSADEQRSASSSALEPKGFVLATPPRVPPSPVRSDQKLPATEDSDEDESTPKANLEPVEDSPEDQPVEDSPEDQPVKDATPRESPSPVRSDRKLPATEDSPEDQPVEDSPEDEYFPPMPEVKSVGYPFTNWHKPEGGEDSKSISSTRVLDSTFIRNFLPKDSPYITTLSSASAQFDQGPLFLGPKKDRTCTCQDDEDGVDGGDTKQTGERVPMNDAWAARFAHLSEGKVHCPNCTTLTDPALPKCQACEFDLPAQSTPGNSADAKSATTATEPSKPPAPTGSIGKSGFSLGAASSSGFSFSGPVATSSSTAGSFSFGVSSAATTSGASGSGGYRIEFPSAVKFKPHDEMVQRIIIYEAPLRIYHSYY